MKPFGLYLVMTDPLVGYEECARAAVECRVRMLQLRMKKAADSEFLAMAKKIRAITQNTETLFIVNDRLDIARKTDADGVHLGQDDMPLEEARARWNTPGKIFGLSTHNLGQACAAVMQNPDYIGVGPVFSTPTKDIPDPTVGLDGLKRILQAVSLPAVAIGGISPGNLPDVLAHGAVNYAVVRAVTQSPDPRAAIRGLLRTAGTEQIHRQRV